MSESSPEPAPLLTVDCWLVDVSGLSDARVARWNDATPGQRERAAINAVSALRSLTGGVVEPCMHVVRPTAGDCGELTWRVAPLLGAGGGLAPRLHSGTWINLVCGCAGTVGACGCSGSTVRLPGATHVVSVLLGGVELDASAWRLESGGVLRRLDGGTWPPSQPLEEPPDGAHAFVVTYYAQRPGRAGELAAGALASEFLEDLLGGDCALPASVTQVSRNGVTMTLTPGVFPGGVTNVLDVDSWVRSVNPYALAEPSQVITPGMPRMNRAAP